MGIELKKIKAFTLSEMIVVLLITVIVVGTAFSILTLVQGQMGAIERNYERNAELNLLRQSLWIDFNTCDRAFYDGALGELVFVNELGRISYRMDDDHIIKGRDTFLIKWKSRKFYFENRETSFGEIDALGFETTNEMGNRPMFIYKDNAATTYLDR